MRSVAAPRRRDFAKVSKGMACIRLLCLLIPLLAADGLAGTPPPEVDPIPTDWLARVQRGIAEQEYEASRNRSGLQAPNRAHNLRTYFDASGIRVHDRSAAQSPGLLGLALVGVGRGGGGRCRAAKLMRRLHCSRV